MSRYIDADELIDFIECGHLRPPTELAFSDLDVIEMIKKQPTADVVEADKAQKEIDYWHDKAQSYEQTILKLSLNKADDVSDYATAHKVVGGGERDGSTCWFECDNCGLAVDIGDVFCKHCGARFVP